MATIPNVDSTTLLVKAVRIIKIPLDTSDPMEAELYEWLAGLNNKGRLKVLRAGFASQAQRSLVAPPSMGQPPVVLDTTTATAPSAPLSVPVVVPPQPKVGLSVPAAVYEPTESPEDNSASSGKVDLGLREMF